MEERRSWRGHGQSNTNGEKLADSLQMMKVRSKRGRAVPILIPVDCQSIFKRLADQQTRSKAQLKEENKCW